MSTTRKAVVVGGLVAALVGAPATSWASPAVRPRAGTYSGKIGIGTDHAAGTTKVTVGRRSIGGVKVDAHRSMLDAAHSTPGCAFPTVVDTTGYARSGSVHRSGSFGYTFSRETVADNGAVIDDVIRLAGMFGSTTALAGHLTRTITIVTPAPAPASPGEATASAQTQRCVSVPVTLHAMHPAGVLWPFPPGPRTVDCSKLKCVALTFDDGPGSQIPQLLRMLRAEHARATFFVLGQMVAAHPDRLRFLSAAGHEIGNHSWSHELMTSVSSAEVASQFSRTDAIVRRIIGVRPTLVRPPYGGVNARVDAVLRSEGHPSVLWDVDPLDWRDRNTSLVASRVLSHVHPGAIVLMHDIHPTTVAAVPRILAELVRRGYTFVTVSELYGGSLRPGVNYYGR